MPKCGKKRLLYLIQYGKLSVIGGKVVTLQRKVCKTADNMAKITVQNTQITVIKQNEDDYISLTDMLKAKDGEFFFSNWLRNRNTIEFLGIWERLMNPNFNCAEFDIIKSQAGLNRFRLSAKEWTEKTNAIGIVWTDGQAMA